VPISSRVRRSLGVSADSHCESSAFENTKHFIFFANVYRTFDFYTSSQNARVGQACAFLTSRRSELARESSRASSLLREVRNAPCHQEISRRGSLVNNVQTFFSKTYRYAVSEVSKKARYVIPLSTRLEDSYRPAGTSLAVSKPRPRFPLLPNRVVKAGWKV
jgi:hypothetical protein